MSYPHNLPPKGVEAISSAQTFGHIDTWADPFEILASPFVLDGLAALAVEKGISADDFIEMARLEPVTAALSGYFFDNQPAPPSARFKNQREQRERAALLPEVVANAMYEAAERIPDREPKYDGRSNFYYMRNFWYYEGRRNEKRGRGFSNDFNTVKCEQNTLEDVGIGVIGSGAAGVIATRALLELGFKNITVFDKKGVPGGIWNKDNVRLGSRNLAAQLTFDSAKIGKIEPGNNGGIAVQEFIHSIAGGESDDRPFPAISRATVLGVEPGDLTHTVHYRDENRIEQSSEFPILIAAPGNGQPAPLNMADQYRWNNGSRIMSPGTDIDVRDAGRRWQEHLSNEELSELVGKKVVIVGLGNSAAEMIVQFEQFREKTGSVIDYTVLTHHPVRKAYGDGSTYEVVDLLENRLQHLKRQTGGYKSSSDLHRLAIDIPHVKDALFLALQEDRIVGGINQWSVDDDILTYTTPSFPGYNEFTQHVDRLYTLIGYRHSPDNLARFAINTNEYRPGGHYDYDGEVQRQTNTYGRDRIYPGYFAIGALRKCAELRSATTIPSILWQAQQMLPMIAARAAEYKLSAT